MYIDFKNPEKKSYQNNNPIKPKKDTSFSAIKKKYSKKKPEKLKEIPIEEIDPIFEKDSSSDELNILDKIKKTIEKHDNTINSDSDSLSLVDEPNLISSIEATVRKRLNNNEAKDDASEESEYSVIRTSGTPPSVPKVGKAGFIPFEFKGNAKEYFKIWIANIALTILTLGIYSAWAKVRSLRYLYGNTYLNNSNFEFNADPKRIFIGRTIIVAFYGLFIYFSKVAYMYKIAIGIVILFLLLLPWLIRQAINFKLKSASYRNIPFKFHAKARSFYWLVIFGFFAIIALPIAIALTSKIVPYLAPILGFIAYILLFVVIIPTLYRRYKALVINNASYANEYFRFTARKRDAISVFFKMGALTFVVSFLFGAIALLISGMGSTLLEQLHIKHIPMNNPYIQYAITAVAMLFYLFFSGLYKGISDGYLSNFVRNHTEIKDAKFKGEISPLRLGWISASNALILVFSLGLLYPWTKLRYLKYKIENTHFACDDYDSFISDGYEDASVIGEETLDFFDIDIGL